MLSQEPSAPRATSDVAPNSAPWRLRRAIHAVVGLAMFAAIVPPARAQQGSADLTNQSLEDLMNTEVTSVSKKEQKISRTASAIFVITQEDIRRSGATNIPDILRMVPGMDVAQINGSTWAISARGFNQQFSNKLLVTIDGRIVYTSTFSGVFWDTMDYPLEDIERIEVIRGPGGSAMESLSAPFSPLWISPNASRLRMPCNAPRRLPNRPTAQKASSSPT